jgi:N-acyl-D-aspartate/D-glutamate deacylase
MIIVRAQKRPQVLLDVPQSISFVSGKGLKAQHANTFRDYLNLVPGLQLDQCRPGEGRLILGGANAKLTSPADTISIRDRERPKPGYFADVVVFDPQTTGDHSTFESPLELSTGVEDVIVNGGFDLRDGKATETAIGRFVHARELGPVQSAAAGERVGLELEPIAAEAWTALRRPAYAASCSRNPRDQDLPLTLAKNLDEGQ